MTTTQTIETYLLAQFPDLGADMDVLDPDGYRDVEIKDSKLSVRGQSYCGNSPILISFVPVSCTRRWLHIVLDDNAGRAWDDENRGRTTFPRPRPSARMRLAQSA